MTKEEKLDKIAKYFSLLPEEKQDHILGVLQALVYANNIVAKETASSDLEQNQNNLMECEK